MTRLERCDREEGDTDFVLPDEMTGQFSVYDFRKDARHGSPYDAGPRSGWLGLAWSKAGSKPEPTV
jgi:hypothetical protein